MATYIIFFFLSLLSSAHLKMTSASVPEFPCSNSHELNSFPFCNSSMAISDRAQTLISLLTLPEKIRYLSNNFTGIPRLGIPPYQWWSESLHGIATNGPGISFNGSVKSATMFPQVLNSAASFNRTLWFAIGSAVSVEARAMYNSGQAGLTYWAPSVNIFRDPRWGRGQETPGEDPVIASSYAMNFVKGFQNQNQEEDEEGLMVSACCKHLIAYDLEKWGNYTRYNFSALVTKQDMEDTYEPPFKSCIENGKASCLMCSYNSINGIPACADGDLLQKARKEWGFSGYITSDCDAVATIFEYQFYTKTAEDAVADALKAGVDINCGTYMLFKTASAIEQGKIKEEDVDRALQNLITVLLRLSLFNGDPLKGMYGRLGSGDVCTEEHQRLALEAATQGIVLLKNHNNFLPLRRDGASSLAVIGPGTNTSTQLLGGYSGVPCEEKNYVEVLQKYVEKTRYAGGCLDVACESNSSFDEAVVVAKASDYVILILGLDLTQETEDKDRVSLLLPGKQMELTLLVASVSKRPLILVLTGGGPLDVSFAKEDPRIASIIWVGYPGEAGGKALAQVIFGDYNPGGRLPMTWYSESFTSIPMNDMNMRSDPARLYPGRSYRFYTGVPVYEFGHGLSYTDYTYRFLSVPARLHLMKPGLYLKRGLYQYQKEQDGVSGVVYIPTEELVSSCEMLRFSVEISVMNMGRIDGSHVVILYSMANRARKDAPRKQVVGFSRVHTSAYGETKTSIEVDPCVHLSFADEHGKRVLPLGEHTLILGHFEQSFSIAM